MIVKLTGSKEMLQGLRHSGYWDQVLEAHLGLDLLQLPFCFLRCHHEVVLPLGILVRRVPTIAVASLSSEKPGEGSKLVGPSLLWKSFEISHLYQSCVKIKRKQFLRWGMLLGRMEHPIFHGRKETSCPNCVGIYLVKFPKLNRIDLLSKC